jgi:peptidyl-dipeptidase A
MVRGTALAALLAGAAAFAADTNPTQERADRFLALVNASYQALAYVENEAQWAASTDVSDVHDAAAETAGKASAAFMGNPALITETKTLLLRRNELDDITVCYSPPSSR